MTKKRIFNGVEYTQITKPLTKADAKQFMRWFGSGAGAIKFKYRIVKIAESQRDQKNYAVYVRFWPRG